MIAEFQCLACDNVIEEYFALYSQLPKEKICLRCGGNMKRLWSKPIVHNRLEVPGYEKETQDQLTLGKAIDGLQRWV